MPASCAENLSKELEDRFVFNLFSPGQVTRPGRVYFTFSPFSTRAGDRARPGGGGVRFHHLGRGGGQGGEGGDSGQKMFHRRVKNSPLFSIHSSNNITQLSPSENILDEVFVVVSLLVTKRG